MTADIRIPAVIVSLLISLWVAWSTDVINNDGVLYLSAAKMIAAGDWGAACGLPKLDCWLLFPSLIAFFWKLTTLSLENSAYLLDAVLSGLMVFVFLTLVRDLGAGRRTLLIAAFIILLHPYLNESRADVIRDHGYWAFYLTTLLFFIRYWKSSEWRYALLWAMAATVATLFRIEGLVFLLLLPLVLLIDTSRRFRERVLLLLKAHTFAGILTTALLGWWVLDPAFSADQAGRLFEPVQRIMEVGEQLRTGLQARVQVIGEEVLGHHLDQYAFKALWAILGLILLSKIFSILTPLYTLPLLFKRLRIRINPPAGLIRVIVWLVILNLGILLVELLTRFVLSGRFAVPLVLTVLLVVPFVFDALYDQWRVRDSFPVQKWILFPVIIAAFLFMSVDGLYSSGKGSKTYLREAGYWLESQVTPASRVLSNDRRVIYYSGTDVDWGQRAGSKHIIKALKRGSWRQYDYVAIQSGHGDTVLRGMTGKILGVPTETFFNNKQDSVLIFRIENDAGDPS